MSNLMDVTVPLWRDGRNGNIQLLSSFKRLQKEDPDLYGLIQQRFETQDAGYQYKVGCSKFGLWLSRRKMDSKVNPDMKEIATKNEQNNDRLPSLQAEQHESLIFALNTLSLAFMASTEAREKYCQASIVKDRAMTAKFEE